MKPAVRVALMAGAVAVAFVAGLMSSGCDRRLSPTHTLEGGAAVAGRPMPGSRPPSLTSTVLVGIAVGNWNDGNRGLACVGHATRGAKPVKWAVSPRMHGQRNRVER